MPKGIRKDGTKMGFKKGYTPWNKDKTGLLSEETLKKMRKANALHGFQKGHPLYPGGVLFKKGIHNNPNGEFKKGQVTWNKGKGNIAFSRAKVWHSVKYQEWRQQVFIRDGFICQKCKIKGGILNAHHHKKSFQQLLEEVKINLPLFDLFDGVMIYTPFWDLDNGITLCKKCHNKTKKNKECLKLKPGHKEALFNLKQIENIRKGGKNA